MSDRYLLSRDGLPLSVLKRLYGGRDCILDEGRRNRKIEELRKRYKGRRLSREVPYTLEKAPAISDKRIARLPKYLTDFYKRSELQRFVENLAELKRIKNEYRPKRQYRNAEHKKISKARRMIEHGADLGDLDDLDEAFELDDVGGLRNEYDDRRMIREAELHEKEMKDKEKRANRLKKFLRRAWTEVLKKASKKKKTAKEIKKEVDKVMAEYEEEGGVEEYFGDFLDWHKNFTYDDVLELVIEEYK